MQLPTKIELTTDSSKLLDLTALIKDLASREEQQLTENELEVLLQGKAIYSKQLLPLAKQNLDYLIKKQYNLIDEYSFYWEIILLGLIREETAFDVMQRICLVSADDIDRYFGDMFITETLPYLLTLTSHGKWQALKLLIENPELYLFSRASCLRATTLIYVLYQTDRTPLVEYFKKLLTQCIQSNNDDESWSAIIISEVSDAWPKECLEEIKELFGYELVDESFIGLQSILIDIKKGLELCTSQLKKGIERFYSFYICKKTATIDSPKRLSGLSNTLFDKKEQKTHSTS